MTVVPAYPTALFDKPSNLFNEVNVVEADHVNELRAETRAIERTLGVTPHIGLTIDPATYAVTGPVTFDDVAARLNAIQAAAMRDFDTFYVSRAGGSVIRRTNLAPGVGIKTLAVDGIETHPALEVLVAGIDGWNAPLETRSSIKLWGSGLAEVGSLRFGASGTLSIDGLAVGNVSLASSGALMLPNGTVLSGGDERLTSSLGSGIIGVRLTVTDASAVPLLVTDLSNTSLFEVVGDGSVAVGPILLDASDSSIHVGDTMLSGTELSLGDKVALSQEEITVTGNTSVARVRADSIKVFSTAGDALAELSATRVRVNNLTLTPTELNFGGFGYLNTARLQFEMDGTVSATQSVTLSGGLGQLTVANGITLTASSTISLTAGASTASLETTSDGSTWRVGAGTLSANAVRFASGARIVSDDTKTDLIVPEGDKARIGVSGVRFDNLTYSQFVEVTPAGVTLSGDVNMVDNVTTIWPSNQDVANTVWLNTKLARTDAVSDLRPTYWDPLLAYNSDSSPNASTQFDFIAPATGDVKITLSAELGGNVSRSALSYQILPYDDNGNLLLAPAVTAGNSHCISFNAPAVDVPGDWYYQNLSNVFITRLEPGKRYRLQVRGQRAWPGTDASVYFPGDPNYPPGYPWGKRFAVSYLRVMVEPVFTSSRLVNSA